MSRDGEQLVRSMMLIHCLFSIHSPTPLCVQMGRNAWTAALAKGSSPPNLIFRLLLNMALRWRDIQGTFTLKRRAAVREQKLEMASAHLITTEDRATRSQVATQQREYAQWLALHMNTLAQDPPHLSAEPLAEAWGIMFPNNSGISTIDLARWVVGSCPQCSVGAPTAYQNAAVKTLIGDTRPPPTGSGSLLESLPEVAREQVVENLLKVSDCINQDLRDGFEASLEPILIQMSADNAAQLVLQIMGDSGRLLNQLVGPDRY